VSLQAAVEKRERNVVFSLEIAVMFSFGYGIGKFTQTMRLFQLAVKFYFVGQGGRLPWFFASPLLLLTICVVYGIAFMVWLTYRYEQHQRGIPHTRFTYSLSLTFGFSSLACFSTGYIWLILKVTG